MTDKNIHTPLPWKVVDDGSSALIVSEFIEKKNNDQLSYEDDRHYVISCSEWMDCKKEDSALIVKAVNNHEKLLDMVKYASLFIYEVASKLPLDNTQQKNIAEFLNNSTALIKEIEEE